MEKYWSRKYLIIGGLSLIALVLLFSVIKSHLSRPVEGRVTSPAAQTKGQTEAKKTLSTPYYSLQYPTTYRLMSPPEHSASLDAQMLLGHQGRGYGTSSHIALTVVDLPEAGITEDSSYLLYKTHPESYAIDERTLGDDTVITAVKTTPDYEKNILWPHGGHLLTISLTTGIQSPVVDDELEFITQHVRWVDTP